MHSCAMAHLCNIVLQAFVSSLLTGFYLDALPYDNEYGPDYGSGWIMVIDNNGTTKVLNYSTLPADERGLWMGDAYFNLYTRRNDVAEIIEIPDKDDSTMNSEYYNCSHEMIMATHGWLGKEESDWLQNIKNEFLKKSDYNVIIVDWSEFARNPIYPWAAMCTRYVGKRVAKLIDAIRKACNTSEETVHLIGHSLGAQVMGYAGMFSETQVDRITGLDPARPLYEIPKMGKDFRLDKTDAEFVDIIHTCGGIYGYLHSYGHADFYPNDGRARQPGCEGVQPMIEGCSHGRSCEFFGESINSDVGFVAYPCNSWEEYENGECKDNPTLMGLPASTERKGNFYLHTRSQPKYAEG